MHAFYIVFYSHFVICLLLHFTLAFFHYHKSLSLFIELIERKKKEKKEQDKYYNQTNKQAKKE